MAKVNKINEQTIHNIKRKSVLAIPDRATDKGWSATSIKQALVGLIVNANDSVISEINRIVEEIQAYFEEFPKGYREIEISITEPEDKTKDKLWLKIL